MGYESMMKNSALPGRIKLFFSRLTIAKKMLLGYLLLSALTVIISAFSLSGLERINRINNSVLKTEVPLIEATDKMVDSLFAQELYGRRYSILRSPDMLELFWKRSEEFNRHLGQIDKLEGLGEVSLKQIESMHSEYNELFIKGVAGLSAISSQPGGRYDVKIVKKQEELIKAIKDLSLRARSSQKEKTLLTSKIGTRAFHVAVVLCIFGMLFGIGAAVLITRNISGSIHQLKIAAEQISHGKFDNIPAIDNQDELGELSNSFGEMAMRLKRLEEMHLDTSPLTRLPDGVAIEKVLKKRLDTQSRHLTG